MIEVVVRGDRYYRIAGGDLFARRGDHGVISSAVTVSIYM